MAFKPLFEHLGGTRAPVSAVQLSSMDREGPKEPTPPTTTGAGAAELDVRATSSAAAHQDDAPDTAGVYTYRAGGASLDAEDAVDRSLAELGIPRQQAPDGDPRSFVPIAGSLTNPELGELLARLAAEHDRVGRLSAKQDFVVGKIIHERRDREVEVRRTATSGANRLEDLVWSDPIYRALNGALLLQQRVLNELKADLAALDRHHAAVSRLIEVRRQEQERDLIGINVAGARRPFNGR